MNLPGTRVSLKSLLCEPKFDQDCVFSPLSCVGHLPPKPTGEGHHCQSQKSWRLRKKGSWRHLCSCWSVVSHCATGKQPLCQCGARPQRALPAIGSGPVRTGITPQSGCDCECAGPTHRNFLVQFKTKSHIYLRLAFLFFFFFAFRFMKSAVWYI